MESEFGHSIHEQRILDQRDLAEDYVRIARNASSIIEYMLRLATSPTVTIDQLPVKIWGRYIRDTVAHAIADLGGANPPSGSSLRSISKTREAPAPIAAPGP